MALNIANHGLNVTAYLLEYIQHANAPSHKTKVGSLTMSSSVGDINTVDLMDWSGLVMVGEVA